MFAYQKENETKQYKTFHFFTFIQKPRKYEVPCEPHCSRHEDDGRDLHNHAPPGDGHLAPGNGLQHLLIKPGTLHYKPQLPLF